MKAVAVLPQSFSCVLVLFCPQMGQLEEICHEKNQ